MVAVATVRDKSVEFKLAAIPEADVSSSAVERIVDYSCERERVASKVLLVCAVIVEPADAKGGVIMWPRRAGRLNALPALRVAFQVELVGRVDVHILGVPRG